MSRQLMAVMSMIFLLVFFASAMSVSYTGVAKNEDVNQQAEITGEEMTIDYGNESFVDVEATIYSDNVTIQSPGAGTLEEGTDYEWDEVRGAVLWLNSTNTEDGNEATIDYTAFEPPEETQNIQALLTPLSISLPYVFLAICGFAALAYGRKGWG